MESGRGQTGDGKKGWAVGRRGSWAVVCDKGGRLEEKKKRGSDVKRTHHNWDDGADHVQGKIRSGRSEAREVLEELPDGDCGSREGAVPGEDVGRRGLEEERRQPDTRRHRDVGSRFSSCSRQSTVELGSPPVDVVGLKCDAGHGWAGQRAAHLGSLDDNASHGGGRM
jgi:hypothetical protein